MSSPKKEEPKTVSAFKAKKITGNSDVFNLLMDELGADTVTLDMPNSQAQSRRKSSSVRSLSQGLHRISKAKQKTGVNQNKSHPYFIVFSVLDGVEKAILQHGGGQQKEPSLVVNETLEVFQQQQIELVKLKIKMDEKAKGSRNWIKKHSKDMQKLEVWNISQKGLWERILFNPLALSPQFRNMVQQCTNDIYQAKVSRGSSSWAFTQPKKSKRWLEKMDEKLSKSKKANVVERHYGSSVLKLAASTNADAIGFYKEAKDHLDIVECASNVNFTLSILEKQLEVFYAWRKSDDFKDMMKAYDYELRAERRIQTHSKRLVLHG